MTKLTGTTLHNESSSEVILRSDSVSVAPEPILAGTTSGIIMTPQEHAHTLSGTTIEESGNLSGTTMNIGTLNG